MARIETKRGDGRMRILKVATAEFSKKGLDGARVDEIAKLSRANKNTIYHHFKSKDNLFTAVLEHVYEDIRSRQRDVDIRSMPPEKGMCRLVEFTADIWTECPEYHRLLSSENLHNGRHVKQSKKISSMYDPLVKTVKELLEAGQKTGIFRKGVDPTELYILIASVSAYHVAHRHTFDAIFRTRLMSPERLAKRKEAMCDVILRYLKP